MELMDKSRLLIIKELLAQWAGGTNTDFATIITLQMVINHQNPLPEDIKWALARAHRLNPYRSEYKREMQVNNKSWSELADELLIERQGLWEALSKL